MIPWRPLGVVPVPRRPLGVVMVFSVNLIVLGEDVVLVLSQRLSQCPCQRGWIVLCRLASGHLVNRVKPFQRLVEKMGLLTLLAALSGYLLCKALLGGIEAGRLLHWLNLATIVASSQVVRLYMHWCTQADHPGSSANALVAHAREDHGCSIVARRWLFHCSR